MEKIYTAGHSNRYLTELLSLLEAAGIDTLVDVRRYPSSRRNPQFNEGTLRNSLRSSGIDYAWEGEALGGRRELPTKPEPLSPQVRGHACVCSSHGDQGI